MDDPSDDDPAGAGLAAHSPWRWCRIGAVALGVLGLLVLALIFLAYGRPDLLLDFANLRYCG